MDSLAYSVTTNLDFEKVVQQIQAETENRGFKVQHIHDVQGTLSARGYAVEPIKIIEICNANFAYQALQRDLAISLMMPCKINVYRQDGKTVINALRPLMLASFFPEANLEQLAAEVDAIICSIVDAVVGNAG